MNYLSLEIGTNFISIVSGSKADGRVSVNQCHFESLTSDIAQLTDSALTIIADISREYMSSANELYVSFNSQSSYFKSVDVMSDSSEELQMEHLEWEMTQVLGEDRKNFVFSIPDVDQADKLIAIAIRKQRVEFANKLAKSLNIKAAGISLNLLNLQQLVASQGFEYQHAIFVLLNNSYVEICSVIDGQMDSMYSYAFDNGIDFNDLNINIRKIKDASASLGKIPDDIYIAGDGIDKSTAENIANAVQISITMVDLFASDNVDCTLELDNKHAFAACIGAII